MKQIKELTMPILNRFQNTMKYVFLILSIISYLTFLCLVSCDKLGLTTYISLCSTYVFAFIYSCKILQVKNDKVTKQDGRECKDK